MATPKFTEFQEFEWESEQEESQAAILTESNIHFIRNQLAKAMTERAQLEYDPLKPVTTFVQQEAALMGQINAYRFLLDSHQQVVERKTQSYQSNQE